MKRFAVLAPIVLVALAATFLTLHWSKKQPSAPTPPADPRAAEIASLVASAESSSARSDWPAARVSLEKAAALDPKNLDVAKKLEGAIAEEKRAKLVKEAEEARAKGDSAAEAAALAEARRLREAEDLKKQEDEARRKVLLDRAEAAAKEGDLATAADAYRKALAMGEDEGARQALTAIEERLKAQESDARRKEAELIARGAATAKTEGRLVSALKEYIRALELDDREEWRESKKRVQEGMEISEQYMKKGLEAWEQGKFVEAKKHLEISLSFQKDNLAAAQLLQKVARKAVLETMVPVPAGVVDGVQIAPFHIDRTEVTDAQYAEFVKATGARAPRHWSGGRVPGEGTGPVMGISAAEADAYAKWAGKRLPTEAEWLLAAGAADGRAYPWGADFDPARANAASTSPKPVGSFPTGASPSGALDMAGNVAEWTSTKDGSLRIVKGGGFLFPTSSCALAWRFAESETLRLNGIGFRCVIE